MRLAKEETIPLTRNVTTGYFDIIKKACIPTNKGSKMNATGNFCNIAGNVHSLPWKISSMCTNSLNQEQNNPPYTFKPLGEY